MNRPLTIWWDFVWDNDDISGVVVENNHPKYKDVRYVIPIDEVADDEGYVDDWVEGPFERLRAELTSGRVSINEWVKNPTMNV